MVTIFVARRYTSPVEKLFRWGDPAIKEVLKMLTYDEAAAAASLPSGCYIFASTDLLTRASKPVAIELHNRLSNDPASTILNDPQRSLNRYGLLRELERRGINSFKARPLDQLAELGFPLFIRHSVLHNGPLSPLLHSEAEVRAVARRLLVKGHLKRDLLAVEFANSPGPDGYFHKYAAFRIGDRFWPHAVWFSNHWRMKTSDVVDGSKVDEELGYIQSNSHIDEIRPIFELANIEYGRIDYTIVDGRLTVFEINLNPTLMFPPPREEKGVMRAGVKAVKHAHIVAGFKALDDSTKGAHGEVSIELPPSLLRPLRAEAFVATTGTRIAKMVRRRMKGPGGAKIRGAVASFINRPAAGRSKT